MEQRPGWRAAEAIDTQRATDWQRCIHIESCAYLRPPKIAVQLFVARRIGADCIVQSKLEASSDGPLSGTENACTANHAEGERATSKY
jgi:hypothetical protein